MSGVFKSKSHGPIIRIPLSVGSSCKGCIFQHSSECDSKGGIFSEDKCEYIDCSERIGKVKTYFIFKQLKVRGNNEDQNDREKDVQESRSETDRGGSGADINWASGLQPLYSLLDEDAEELPPLDL